MEHLIKILKEIDGRGYKAYKTLQGKIFAKNGISVKVLHVQGDPFATPSVLEIAAENKFPEISTEKKHIKTAIEDMIARRVHREANVLSFNGGTGHSGKLFIPKPSQAVLERSSVKLTKETATIRIFAGLPANGRRINGKSAVKLFNAAFLLAERTLFPKNYGTEKINEVINLAENQHFIRGKLSELGIVTFVADGSVLPRRSGADERKLEKGAVPFVSPDSLAIKITLPDGKTLRGMGIKRGITLIAGGGYHGKTTLLEAIQNGIYNHIKGDGREYVITDETAVKIRSEDGRSIRNVDISNFLSRIPNIKDTEHFSSDDASGSTSMAAAISEAMEMQTHLLLFDEDTCATNFMIRDARMQKLVRKEPIIPLIDRLRDLYAEFVISSILVIGGAGDYLDVCDTVIVMEEYRPIERTNEAKEIAATFPSKRNFSAVPQMRPVKKRILNTKKLLENVSKEKVKLKGKSILQIGREEINLSLVEEFAESGQYLATGRALLSLRNSMQTSDLFELILSLEKCIDQNGIECLFNSTVYPTLTKLRRFEIASALNRLRSLII
jgi:predicted ABC-class ATPase